MGEFAHSEPGGNVLRLDHGSREVTLIPRTGRRFGQWRVQPGENLPWLENSYGPVPLNYALLRMNKAPVGQRYPVLIDLSRIDEIDPVPVTTMHGTGLPDPMGQLCWLDRRQLGRLGEPDRAVLIRARDDLYGQLESGEQLGGFLAYPEPGSAWAELAARYSDGPKLTPYDQLPPLTLGSSLDLRPGLTRQAAPTPDYFERRGQACIRADHASAAELGDPDVVLVRPRQVLEAGEKIATLARLVSTANVEPGQVQVDQVIRNALGVEIGEEVALDAAQTPRRSVLDFFLGPPSRLTCRVQPADLTTVEREVCLADALSLELLGVESGDDVVIDGIFDPGHGTPAIPAVRVKAFHTSEEVLNRRVSLAGGDLTSRFPASLDSLGVFPDLPWVFLDSATRTALGLAGQKLGVVRLRASRSYQIGKELRELMLVLAIAFIGIVSVVEDRPLLVTLLITLVIGIVSVVLIRIRSRLARVLRRHNKHRR